MNNDIDKYVDNAENYKYTIFYFNSKDSRIIVPKRNRLLGWQLNFGKRNTYIIIIFIAIIIIISKLYL
ncbi:MAG: hypothetical protein CMF58_01425 [Lentimicrobiaceae bacterium]|jgi:uncharacterized membrane protein|nr:hypothetical protein [Lentimicrobiaceae bacterium]